MGSAWLMASGAELLESDFWSQRNIRVMIWTAALTGGLLLGALVIAWIDRWRKRVNTDKITPTEQLSNFRSLYERGELSREEYDRIRSRLSQKIRQELNVPQRKPTGLTAPDAPAASEPPTS